LRGLLAVGPEIAADADADRPTDRSALPVTAIIAVLARSDQACARSRVATLQGPPFVFGETSPDAGILTTF
jgi:hypothetical protein